MATAAMHLLRIGGIACYMWNRWEIKRALALLLAACVALCLLVAAPAAWLVLYLLVPGG